MGFRSGAGRKRCEARPRPPTPRQGWRDEELVSVRRPAIASKIKAARELGDLSENFEYHAAKNEQGFMEARINELEQIIKNHVLIEKKPGRSELVAMGSTVRFREDGEDEE